MYNCPQLQGISYTTPDAFHTGSVSLTLHNSCIKGGGGKGGGGPEHSSDVVPSTDSPEILT